MPPRPDLSPLVISLATTCTATVATFVLGLAAARWMQPRRGRLRSWLDGLLTLPLVLPPTVVGFLLLLVFGRRSPMGQLLEMAGIAIVFSWPATVLAATVVAFPLMYRTALGALDQVNPALPEAARTLGASEMRVFLHIQLPLARPGMVAGAVLASARALGEFGATLMIAGNIPGRTQTMPIAIYSAAEGGDMRGAAVWVALIVVLSVALVRLLNLESRNRFPTRAPLDPSGPSGPGALVHASESRSSSTSLAVELERDLPAFPLRVQLQAGRGAVGLLGASGAGKSLTLRMIAGVAQPTGGRITLNGRTVYDSAAGIDLPPARRRIGMVFQDYALFPHLTVAENVAFGLRLPRQERPARVAALLGRMRIAELAHAYPAQISGGQRQRVALARALAAEPEALLLDEPFGALDPHLRRQMEEQLRRDLAAFGGPVLMVTHDMEEAFRFCSSLVVLDRGQVIASGPRAALFEQPRTTVAARLTGCKNIAAARPAGPKAIEVEAWQCQLTLDREPPAALTAAGFRSHHFNFVESQEGANCFPCWLVETSEAPHEVTLYLRLHRPPEAGDGPHLQADLPKPQWRTLSQRPQPWFVALDPGRILLLED